MTSMLVIVPSRGRPQNIERLLNGFTNTSTGRDTALLIAVDEDDPELEGYKKLPEENAAFDGAGFALLTVGPRLRLGGTLNSLAPKFVEHYDIIGFMGDDHLPQTIGWDERIAEAMVSGGVVYGNDLFQGPNLPTAVFFDSRVIETLGYFVPTGLVHLFFDNVWKDWGEHTGKLRYLPDVIIEHIHPHAGKGEMDARYEEVNSPEMWGPDEARYNEYKASGEFAADIEKLRAL